MAPRGEGGGGQQRFTLIDTAWHMFKRDVEPSQNIEHVAVMGCTCFLDLLQLNQLWWLPQEVVGSEMSALQSVVAADVELMALREEEAAITARLGELGLGDQAEPSGEDADDEADSDRLNQIYERMQVRFVSMLRACVGSCVG